MKHLSVIIVNYNVSPFLEQALLSVRKALARLNAPAEVFVVDNNSADDSVQMVQQRFPEVTLIANSQNVGFAKANNQAIRQATGTYILLLNPDTIVAEDTFVHCCRFMDTHPAAGGLGVQMLNGQGVYLPESKRGLPTPEVSFYKIFGLTKLFPHSKTFARYYLGHLNKNQTHEIEVLAGAFMFLRYSVLDKVGLLDEAFFMYGEDIDLSYRICQAGYKNYYYPHTRIIHYKGESTRRNSLQYVYVFYRAMAIFYRKHFSDKRVAVYSILVQLAILLRAGTSVGARLIYFLLPFLDDAALIYAGLLGLRVTYEKFTGHALPALYTTQVIPVATLIWLVSLYLNKGYSKPFRYFHFFRGILTGTLVLAAVANFWQLPNFFVLGGAVGTLILLTGKRMLYHYLQYKNWHITRRPRRRIAVVGHESETKRAIQVLKQSGRDAKVIGFVSINGAQATTLPHLGSPAALPEIIKAHQVDELIFCGKDVPVTEMMSYMEATQAQAVQYKMLPEASNYLIGRSPKYTPVF